MLQYSLHEAQSGQARVEPAGRRDEIVVDITPIT